MVRGADLSRLVSGFGIFDHRSLKQRKRLGGRCRERDHCLVRTTSSDQLRVPLCLLSLFRTIEFPPPHSGWEEFTYPVQLLGQDEAQRPENKALFKGKAK